MALNIIVTKKPVAAAYATFCRIRAVNAKRLAKICMPPGVDPIAYAAGWRVTDEKAFSIALEGAYLDAFNRVHGLNGETRAFIIIT